MRALMVAGLTVLAVVLPLSARGDSCEQPGKVRTYSPSRRFEAIVEPRGPEHRPLLTIWEWRDDRRVRSCRRPMVNRRSPEDLHVTDSGHVVTFDDWCRAGWKHALVVYSPSCVVVRDADLEQLVPPERLEQTNRSVGSRRWIYYGEPILVGVDAVSFTSTSGMTATVSVSDGTLSWSGPPFKTLARLVRGDLSTLHAADFHQQSPRYHFCSWRDEKVSCFVMDGDPKEYFSASSPRASLMGRLEPALRLQHLTRKGWLCRGGCDYTPNISLEFREGFHTYHYEFKGNTGLPEEAEAQDALMRGLGFKTLAE